MPVKFLSLCCKARTIRALVSLLLLFTFVFTLYHILFGKSLINFSLNEDILYRQQREKGLNKKHDNTKEFQNMLPKFYAGFGIAKNKYENERLNGKCPVIKSFKPDIDTTTVYRTVEFDGDWQRTKEYWNPFFEDRYQQRINSKHKQPLKVIVVPHSHNDPGWLKTYEEYYNLQTKHVLDNAVNKMTELKNMTFIWSEISFLSKWWDEAHPRKRALLRALVQEGRFEIVTGGWVMTDEATVNLYSMIDQLVEGQQWVKSHLNVAPISSWSVDPFGHGASLPYILKKSGIEGMVIQNSDFEWVQRFDNEKLDGIYCHNMPYDIYSIKHSCGPHPQVCLNFDFRSLPGEYSENSMIMEPITDRNVKQKSELLIEQYQKTASLFTHNVVLIPLGDDFRYVKKTEWDQQYHNYMKMFQYINSRKNAYNVEIGFGTLKDYFKKIQSVETYKFPTLSGDFHVYSDIFSNGSPAYWSGYYGTRPFWKKLYRETENVVRGAEILFTITNALANQNYLIKTQKILSRSYENLTVARRWLGLFAHHDATTGTSKANTMMDYGNKLLEAHKIGETIQMEAISTVVFGDGEIEKLVTDKERDSFDEPTKQLPIKFETSLQSKKVVLYNNLPRHRYHVVKLLIQTDHVEVLGPSGEFVQAQLNPVLKEVNDSIEISSDVFELTFLASLFPLSLSIFEVRQSTLEGKHNAVKAEIYCKHCYATEKLFDIKEIKNGDIQLNNNHINVLFDRNTGLLISITLTKEDITANVEMTFGAYGSVHFRSGAYLLMPELYSETKVPYEEATFSQTIIVSGPISSELALIHSPIIMSTKILHVGSDRMQKAIYVQNEVNVGQVNGEFYMRFATDLKSASKVHQPPTQENGIGGGSSTKEEDVTSQHQPTFYTDQTGYTVEKRIKLPIKYEGNTYPVNTMAFLQDDPRKLRFSVLVDRAHGFCSMEIGRLETLVERRMLHDDSRGMGEGVTDNRPTVSNYVLLLEHLGGNDKMRHAEKDYRNYQPTLAAHHHTQELSYPAFHYLVTEVITDNKHPRSDVEAATLPPPPERSDNTVNVYPFLNQELPCDSSLINLRTITDTTINPDLNFPSRQALLIVQKLGYLCIPSDEKADAGLGCGNPNPANVFYPETEFNGLKVNKIRLSNLTGVPVKGSKGVILGLHDITAKPYEIVSAIVNFA